jgi:replication factor C subunit 2/4
MQTKPWVDKYRPKKIEDIIHQEDIVNVLKTTLKTGELPHLLLYGQPGVGKTSTILAFARQLFGPKISNQRIIELNASDDRGIGVVRNTIITFAKTAIGNTDPNYPCPPYKLIILDEADAMTTEAQSALRKVMEEFSELTRFCFICNYINQIIDPIASRCMKFRFKPISSSCLIDKLNFICKNENLVVDSAHIDLIAKSSRGDARKAIMTLQKLKYIYDYKNGSITHTDVYDIVGGIPESRISPVIKICLDNKSTVEHILKNLKEFMKYGYSINYILDHLKNIIINTNSLNDMQKSKVMIQLSCTERRILDGSDEFLQLLNVLVYILGVKNNKTNYLSIIMC